MKEEGRKEIKKDTKKNKIKSGKKRKSEIR